MAQLKSGESLFGKDGAFAPMLKSFIEAALEAEMDTHLDPDERNKGNKRNAKSELGDIQSIRNTFIDFQEYLYQSQVS